MPFYTSEQILNQAFDSESGTMKTSNDQLGTPGTGEPAHAGGSTGLIGWARDILAKIAAFGTSGVPSDNVISVQGPPNQYADFVFTAINQSLVLNCEGLGAAVFYSRVGASATFQVQLDFGGGNWFPCECMVHAAGSGTAGPSYAAFYLPTGQWATVSTRGAKQVRITTITYSTTGAISGIVSLYPLVTTTEVSNFNAVAILPTVNTVGTVTTPSACSVYYTDTTTPLGAGATFTGSSRTMAAGNNKFVAYTVADQVSFTDGFRIQSSVDNTNWFPIEKATSTVLFGTGSCIAKLVADRDTSFYRVSLTNGPYGQSILRITSSQTPA